MSSSRVYKRFIGIYGFVDSLAFSTTMVVNGAEDEDRVASREEEI